MSIITKASAKNYFLTGFFPTQSNFADTIDSYLGLGEIGNQTVSGAVSFAKTITVSGKTTGSTASFTGKVSAKAGLNTTIISATGDINAATGRLIASAATVGNKVSANQLYASTVTVSGANITGVKGTASIVASVSGAVTNGHFATWNSNGNLVDGAAQNTYQAQPSNPTGTNSLSYVMMGLNGAIAPTRSGIIVVIITGTFIVGSAVSGNLQIRYGTGTAPNNGASAIGTAVGPAYLFTSNSSALGLGFSCAAVITGLTVGTPIWLDLALDSNGSVLISLQNIGITAFEL